MGKKVNQFNKTVLAVHAHPDDTEAFCSGTLKLLSQKGYRIVIATMTAGGLGGVNLTESETVIKRKKEAQAAAAVLGADYHCFGGKDGYLYDTKELRLAVTSLIRKINAGIVLTHLPFDYHSDHRTTCNIVESAAMVASLSNVPCDIAPVEITPLLYHTAPLGFSDPIGGSAVPPHFFVNISSVFSTKMDMLSLHKSQIDLMKIMHKMDDFFGEMKRYSMDLGKMAGFEYAEAFWQHMGGGFQKDSVIQNELLEYLKINES